MKSRVISVQGADVTIATRNEQDYIFLADMVRNFDGGSALIVWEQLNNPVFNSLEFEGIRSEAGTLC